MLHFTFAGTATSTSPDTTGPHQGLPETGAALGGVMLGAVLLLLVGWILRAGTRDRRKGFIVNRMGAAGRTGGLIAACTLAALCGLLATPALAYFTSGGSGTGTSRTGTLKPLVIHHATAGSTSTPLYPGKSGDLAVKVSNPNSSPVTLRRVAQGGGVSVDRGAGCTNDPGWPETMGTSGLSIPEPIELTTTLDSGETLELHLPGAASMSPASATGCQGATFYIPITLEVSQ